MAVDEKDKKEKYVKFLFELLELPEAFMSLQVIFVHLFLWEINSDRVAPICNSMHHHLYLILCVQMETGTILNGTRYYIMAVTPTRLYSFTGIGLLEVSLALTPILVLDLLKLGNIGIVKLSIMFIVSIFKNICARFQKFLL